MNSTDEQIAREAATEINCHDAGHPGMALTTSIILSAIRRAREADREHIASWVEMVCIGNLASGARAIIAHAVRSGRARLEGGSDAE